MSDARGPAAGMGSSHKPPSTTPIVDRPRIHTLLDGALRRRLTTLVAGPGYGKTTVLSQWAADRPCAWHTAAPTESELSVFVRHLVDELRTHIPILPSDITMAIAGVGVGSGAKNPAPRAEALAASLCAELERSLDTDMLLVVDDVHELDADEGAMAFLEALCRNAPPRLHVVLATRSPLPFSTARLRVSDEAFEILAEELSFTADEVDALVRATGDTNPSERTATLLERTAGWPVAVVLALRAGLDGPDQTADTNTLFAYLADEVIGSGPPGTLTGLKIAAHLPWITPDLIQFVAGADVAAQLFGADRNIYLTRTSAYPDASTLTPLVREFVLQRHPVDDTERAVWAPQATAWFERNGALTEALACAMTCADGDVLAEVLLRNGRALLAAGDAKNVLAAIESAGDAPDTPEMLLLEADARQTLGDWEGAMRCYSQLIPDRGPIEPAIASRLGFLHYMRGNIDEALAACRRGVTEPGEAADRAALLAWMASAHWLRAERDEAKQRAHEALETAQRASDSRAMATAHTVLAMVAALDGDRASNDAHYLRALEHAERARDVMQTIRIRSNRGSHFLEEGDYRRSMMELDIALRLAGLSGFEFWRAMALANRGEIHLHTGHLDEAISELEESAALFRSLGSSLEAYPMARIGEVYEVRGNRALARAAFATAIDLAEGPADQQALIPALAGMARLVVTEDPQAAADLAERAAEPEAVLGHGRAVLTRAIVARTIGDHTAARALVDRAAAIARDRRDRPGLAEALEVAASVTDDISERRARLEQARDLWHAIGEQIGVARTDVELARIEGGTSGSFRARAAAEILQAAGAKRAAADARALGDELVTDGDASVGIKTLGGFQVIRAGTAVPTSEWQSRVAREVVWMLVTSRGRPVHREVLIDRLWPDQPMSKAGNRLSVALSTIRNVFDPERIHQPDHYLVADRERVALNHDHLSIDIEHFHDEATLGRTLLRQGDTIQGLAAFRSAEARYVGEFLEEEPYADWATGLREETRTTYMTIAAALAEHETEAGRHEEAARLHLRILERDPFSESAHLGLVSSMAALGRHGTARRLYGVYVSRMAELDIEPAAFPHIDDAVAPPAV